MQKTAESIFVFLLLDTVFPLKQQIISNVEKQFKGLTMATFVIK